MKELNEDKKAEIRPYTTKELCNLYKVSRKSFCQWMRLMKQDIGPRGGNYFTLKQVRIIFEELGEP